MLMAETHPEAAEAAGGLEQLAAQAQEPQMQEDPALLHPCKPSVMFEFETVAVVWAGSGRPSLISQGNTNYTELAWHSCLHFVRGTGGIGRYTKLLRVRTVLLLLLQH